MRLPESAKNRIRRFGDRRIEERSLFNGMGTLTWPDREMTSPESLHNDLGTALLQCNKTMLQRNKLPRLPQKG